MEKTIVTIKSDRYYFLVFFVLCVGPPITYDTTTTSLQAIAQSESDHDM